MDFDLEMSKVDFMSVDFLGSVLNVCSSKGTDQTVQMPRLNCWMADLLFYVLFNSISVISGQWTDDIIIIIIGFLINVQYRGHTHNSGPPSRQLACCMHGRSHTRSPGVSIMRVNS